MYLRLFIEGVVLLYYVTFSDNARSLMFVFGLMLCSFNTCHLIHTYTDISTISYLDYLIDTKAKCSKP